MFVSTLKLIGWTIVDIVAAIVALAVIPVLMLAIAAGCICVSVGTYMILSGSGAGPGLAAAGGLILIVALLIGFIVDYLYSFLH